MRVCARIVLAMLFSIALTSSLFAQDKKETAFDRIIRTGTIRCGYAVWYPELIKDPNTGALSGYDYDVMNAVGKILGLKVEWVEEVGWGIAQNGLEAGRYDIACNGFWGPPARTKMVLQSIPFAHHPVFVVIGQHVKAEGSGTAWLNDPKYKMAILRGTISDVVAQMNFPKAQTIDAAELSSDGNILSDLAAGKSDFSEANSTAIYRYLEQNPSGVRMLEPAIGVAGSTFLIPDGDFRLKHMIDSAIQYLIDFEGIAPIMKKYVGEDSKAWVKPPSYEIAQ